MLHRLTYVGTLLLTTAYPSAAQTPPATPPSSQPATASQPTGPIGDLFLQLKVVTPKSQLGPIQSVRLRDKKEAQDRSREGTVHISINSSPKGIPVYYGGKALGNTPLTLSAKRGSTPFDVVLRARGYMTLRTRIWRKTDRGYFFKLNPAKIR